MQITLSHFEKIDSLLGLLLRMGPFETCADPRGYIRTSNMLFDACIDGTSYDFTNDFVSAEECAAHLIAQGLLGMLAVVEEV